jgi:hypothetical protein
MATYTYNQIINQLKTISLSSPFVKRFGAGEIEQLDTDSSESTAFPICWCVPQNVEIGENSLNYRFRIMVMDIDNTDDAHQQEILSDTLRTLIDIVKSFRYAGGNDYTLVEPPFPSANPFSHNLTDYVVGWYCDINIATDMNNDPCDIPEEL